MLHRGRSVGGHRLRAQTLKVKMRRSVSRREAGFFCLVRIKSAAQTLGSTITQIFEIIGKINKESNTTVFLVEQNANLALKLAHRGYVMENGAITLTDTAANLLANEAVKSAYLGI